MTPPEPDFAANATAVGSGLTTSTAADQGPTESKRRGALGRGLRRTWRRGRARTWKAIIASTEWFRGGDTLDRGLGMLNEQLGLMPDADDDGLARREPATVARPTAEVARSIVYAPDMDGQTDPGEVVWAPVLLEGDAEKPRERAVVVVGRHKQTLLGALISTHQRHADSPHWLFIGSGAWDPEGRPSWVRLDKILEVPEAGIRRSGAVMPRRRFDRIAARLRSDYHWS
ncbi:type II toxin-antitoxin system PemK/MazF family toxin [Corynebacterium sp. NPDC060344]|uniref:type II toxin-antitoxin system PemK/MazF family toxin n=1 Tax=Corynebacterium sp. NPDC060344 TaxID=3347101 RepID=UPI003663D647